MTNTYRTTTAVIALTVAALATPTLAHAKRMGGSKSRSIPPASIGKAPSTPAASVAPKAPAAPPLRQHRLRLRLRQPLLPDAARA